MDAANRRAHLERGAAAERFVADALEADGWLVLDRNWRGGGGEIDLVVLRGDQLRFVEVKARDPRDPTGADAVGHVKRRKLLGAAEAWLLSHEADADVAFAVALVALASSGWGLEWLDNAFDAG